MTSDIVLQKCVLRPITLAIAEHVSSGTRQADWAVDYPTDGDVVICHLVVKSVAAGATYEAPSVTKPWSGPWQILTEEAGELVVVGAIGFKSGPREDSTIEVGYGIAESARGRGVVSSALRALVELVERHGVQVIAETEPGNLPSEFVLRACGFLPSHQAEDGNTWWALA